MNIVFSVKLVTWSRRTRTTHTHTHTHSLSLFLFSSRKFLYHVATTLRDLTFLHDGNPTYVDVSTISRKEQTETQVPIPDKENQFVQLKKGWLFMHSKGNNSEIKKRWFLLTETRLSWYKTASTVTWNQIINF